MKKMSFTRSLKNAVMEISFDSEYKSLYGFFAADIDGPNTIAVAYAFHKLEFTIAAQKVKRLFRSTKRKEIAFAADDIKSIKDTFSRYKALDILQKEGVIQAIQFVD